MAAPKGHARYGGRKKGVKNKDSIPAQELADKLGVDPFEILLLFAKGDWAALGYKDEFDFIPGPNGPIEKRIIAPELRQKAAKDSATYLRPQLKSLEVSNKDEQGFMVMIKDFSSGK